MGRIVAQNLEEKKVEFIGALGSSILKVIDMDVARTGLTEEEAQTQGVDYNVVLIKGMDHGNSYPGGKPLYLKLIYAKKSRTVLGAQMVGYNNAVLRINALALAIYSKITLEELALFDFAYAPPFATTWDIINIAASQAK